MLKLKDAPSRFVDVPAHATPEAPGGLDLATVLGILRKHWPLIVAISILLPAIALGYVIAATPLYTATTTIMVDPHQSLMLQKQQIVTGFQVDTGVVDSQVEILKSDGVALMVVHDLKLASDPEFVSAKPSIMNFVFSLLGAGEEGPPSSDTLERIAVQGVASRTKVKRMAVSYIIDVSFTSESAAKAARIANAIADAYLVAELDAKFQATKRASKWLQDRIQELRDQATAADRAVQSYKSQNNIVDTSRGLMSEQELSDVNSQLLLARAATAEAKARLDRIQEISSSDAKDITDGNVADALRNDVITRLRAQYLDMGSKLTDWSTRFGAGHLAVVNLRNQMNGIRRAISDEVQRIAQTYKSDYEIARAREQSLQNSVDQLVGRSGTTNQAQVALRDLESSAQTFRNLYDNFLERYTDATQQQSFPINDARVITAATEPLGKSAPKTLIIMGGSVILGIAFGAGAAVARELLNTGLRTSRDVESRLGVECLGILPAIPRAPKGNKPRGASSQEVNANWQMSHYAMDEPFSRFAETLRSVKVAIDLARLTRELGVIAIVSALPREGKSTVAANLAQLVAQMGNRTLLIDLDSRSPSLTRAITSSGAGLLEVLSKERTLSDVILTDPKSGLDFLPAVVSRRISHAAELLSSESMANLLKVARSQYEYIFLDTAPMLPVVDVRAAGHLFDGFVMIVEWARTGSRVAREAITSTDNVEDHMIGVVLNRADPAALKRHESYKGRYYHSYYLNRSA